MPPVSRQIEQQVVLLHREADTLAAAVNQVLFQMDRVRPHLDLRCFRPSPLQQPLNLDDQLPHQKGFGDVIVPAQLQPGQAVDILVAGGNEDHIAVGILPLYLPKDGEAVDVREHNVDHPQVSGLVQPLHSILPPQVAADGVALLLQIFGNQIVENGLVLQNADPHAAHTSLPNCSGA